MDFSTAKSIVIELAKVEARASTLSALGLKITDQEEQNDYLLRLGNWLGRHWTDILAPIVSEYPELDPDGAFMDEYETIKAVQSERMQE